MPQRTNPFQKLSSSIIAVFYELIVDIKELFTSFCSFSLGFFFITIGMQLDLGVLFAHFALVLALLVAVGLFLWPIDWAKRRFAMTWDDAVANIEWGVLALVAGSRVVGDLIADKNVGLGNLLGAQVVQAGPV
mgnify:CR=1 FL=1